MKALTLFVVGVLMLGASPARAQFAVGAALEYFQWTEDTAPIEVQETGPMFVLGVDFTQRRDRGLLFAYRGKLYIGDVDYEGALLFFPNVPASGTTRYRGTAHEGQLRYRLPPERGYWLDVLGSLGVDLWERKLSEFQQEDYRVAFVRLGLELNAPSRPGWTLGAGLKYPVWTEEDANLLDEGYDQNPKLEPGGDVSAYAHIGYRFQRNFALIGYLDGFNFKESPPITVTRGGQTFAFFQPASRQYNIGVKLQYVFD